VKKALLIGGGVALVGALAFTFYPGKPVPTPKGPAAEALTARWLETVAEKAQQGMWLVVRGSHIGDQVVAMGTAGTLTHAAVLDKTKNEVIEAVAEGVVATPLTAFLAQAHRLEIVRPPGYTPEEGAMAVARARSRIGHKYDWLGTLGAGSEERYYCTELAVDAWRGRDRGWNTGKVILPAEVPRLGEVLFDSGPRKEEQPLLARFARKLADVRGVAYAAEVAPGIYRGGTPDEDGIKWLQQLGVKTVINLRHYHGETEGERVKAAGMRYERIALESSDPPKPEQVARFLALIRDPSLRPVYVHCLHGVDRTGTMMAIYRMEVDRWNNRDAALEMDYFGAHAIWRDLKHYVELYKPQQR
jgi:hypothetical protein